MRYIDLDGVLADLDSWLLEKNPGALHCKEVYKTIVDNYKTCFLESKPIEENFSLLEGDYRILTSLPRMSEIIRLAGIENFDSIYRTLYSNKLKWCLKHNIPLSRVIICLNSEDKLRFCSKDDELFDDYYKTVQEWNKIGKGIYIESHRK